MKYQSNSSNNSDKSKNKQNTRTSFSKEFTVKYDEIERLTEQMYSK